MRSFLPWLLVVALLVGCGSSPAEMEQPPAPPPADSAKQPVPPPDSAAEPPANEEDDRVAARAEHARALEWIGQARWLEAAAALKKAVELDPSLAEGWNDLSYVLLRDDLAMGEHANPPASRLYSYADAISAAERALSLEPDWAYAQYNLGLALLAQGEYGKAVEPLRRSMEQQPERPEPAAALGLAYVGLSEWDKAVAVCRTARELAPDSLTAADCLRLAGDGLTALPPGEAAIGGRRYESGKFTALDLEAEWTRISPPYTCALYYADGFRVVMVGCHGDGWPFSWMATQPQAGKTPAGLAVGSTVEDLLRLYGESARDRFGYHYLVADLLMVVSIDPAERVGSIRFERRTPNFAVDELIHDRVRQDS